MSEPVEGVGWAGELQRWLDRVRRRCPVTVRIAEVAASRAWNWREGRLEHRSGRFFTVEGLRVRSAAPWLDGLEQPLVVQPEVGILGLLLRESPEGFEALVQAKVEPGNVGGAQLAPTLQATRSNYEAVHGGARPLYLERFLDPSGARVLVDVLLSEQGSRFLRKRNRNMALVLPPTVSLAPGPDHVWAPLTAIVALARQDHLVNTDLRSVISVLPWGPGGAPDADPFALALAASARRSMADESATDRDVVDLVAAVRRAAAVEVEPVPLESLREWERVPWGLRRTRGGAFDVVHVAVEAPSREVAFWDQPIVRTHGDGLVAQVCQVREGILRFLVHAVAEVGTTGGAELTASFHAVPEADGPGAEPGMAELGAWLAEAPPGWIRWGARQSEEGGRFLEDVNRYLLVEAPEEVVVPAPPASRWLTLGSIAELTRAHSLLSNEARSLMAGLPGGR